MDVIILNGMYQRIPQRTYGPYLLKHILKKRGYTCQVIDFCQEYTPDKLTDLIKLFLTSDTICIGVSTTFWSNSASGHIAVQTNNIFRTPGHITDVPTMLEQLKNEFPKLKIIFGGTKIHSVVKGMAMADAAFTGESEDTLPDVLDHWTKNTMATI